MPFLFLSQILLYSESQLTIMVFVSADQHDDAISAAWVQELSY